MITAAMNVLVQDSHPPYTPTTGGVLRVVSRRRVPRHLDNLFVLASADDLRDVAAVVREANSRHQLRALFVRTDSGPELLVHLLERADLRTLRNMIVHGSDPSVPRRVLNAWALGAQHDLIAHAGFAGDILLVASCALELFEVPVAGLPPLARMTVPQRANMVVADDGAYLEWPEADVHLDLDSIRMVLDPGRAEKAAWKKVAHDQAFGAAVAAVRQATGLRQSDIPGVSARQVHRIEQGAFPRVATIERLAAAHGSTSNQYLNRVAGAMATAPQHSGVRDGTSGEETVKRPSAPRRSRTTSARSGGLS